MRRSDHLPLFHMRAILYATLICAFLTIGTYAIPEAHAAPGDRLVAVYQARPVGDQGVSSDGLAALQQTIERRLSAYGISDFIVQMQGSDQIAVEIPNSNDVQQILILIGQVGLCEFVGSDRQLTDGIIVTTSLGGIESVGLNPDGTRRDAAPPAPTDTGEPVYQTILQNTDIMDATIQTTRNGGIRYPVIALTVKDTASMAFGNYTGAHVGTFLSVVVDKRVLVSAVINSRIDGGAIIESSHPDDLPAVVAFLRSGPLIVPLALIDTHTV